MLHGGGDKLVVFSANRIVRLLPVIQAEIEEQLFLDIMLRLFQIEVVLGRLLRLGSCSGRSA